MKTLLQTLLYTTLSSKEQNSILGLFVKKVLPVMEQVFGLTPALGGSETKFADRADQSLVVHILNGLIVAWNLGTSSYLSEPLSEVEQKLLCLGFTLHDYDKYFHGQGEQDIQAHEVIKILQRCEELSEKLQFHEFWSEWRQYLPDICFLAQNTQRKKGSNRWLSNWEINGRTLNLDMIELDRLCDLLTFGDIAVHMSDPAEVEITNNRGKRLQDCLDDLGIEQRLLYHRLRDCRGLLTNQIHNAVVTFARKVDWLPILYFAQGVVYLASLNQITFSLNDIQIAVWENLMEGDGTKGWQGLEHYFSSGEVGFVRDGKGLKVAPQTVETFSSSELIRQLPHVVINKVANIKSLATPKRVEKLNLSEQDRKWLLREADVWADRLAEFIILAQKEFFENCEGYISWVLKALGLQNGISIEQTQVQSGGVNYGWYEVAARHIATCGKDRHPGSKELSDFLVDLGDRLAIWAEENNLLKEKTNPTKEAFFNYVAQYLEMPGLEQLRASFQHELLAYTKSKIKNQPICSLSSGEFVAEDQLDSVVLFKPQQYSNKNALGGRRIKRGISKIWSLEMILRQAVWSAPAGQLEDRQPIFLYVFPAYVYSPQVAVAMRHLLKKLGKWINLWDVQKHCINEQIHLDGLHALFASWLDKDSTRQYGVEYSTRDLPFVTMHPIIPSGKTHTEAWVIPTFLALALPKLLGVKVVATASPEPLYTSDKEFLVSVKLDGPANFWNFLGLDTSLRLQDLEPALKRLLVAYSMHLDNRSKRLDGRWQALNGTVRDLTTDILNVFAVANEGLRRNKRDRPTSEEVKRNWNYAQVWIETNQQTPKNMNNKERTKPINDRQVTSSLSVIEQLVNDYRNFYRVNATESSHAILLPLSIAVDSILSAPAQIESRDLILEGAGQIQKALERRDVYRPILMVKSSKQDYLTRLTQEFSAIQTFMTFCVEKLFMEIYRGDRALLQENRNRIKSGAEFAYRWLALQERQAAINSQQTVES